MKKNITPEKNIHFPVLLNEVENLCSNIQKGEFLDCTFGGGGYSIHLLNKTNSKIDAVDRDENIKFIADEVKKKFPERFRFFNQKFSQIGETFKNKKFDVIIFDLGLSSYQLKDLSRGFSFKSKDKLKMNMGLNDLNLIEVLNSINEKNLKLIIKVFGEEKEAGNIAKNIIKRRTIDKISNTGDLVEIIKKSKKKNFNNKIDVCTKTFQALRILINQEVSELLIGLVEATKLLKTGGKILVISFHSIEDKIVKYFFKNFSFDKPNSSRYLPRNNKKNNILFEKFNKVIKPSQKEISLNPPSRSAKLRYAIRCENNFEFPNDFFESFEKYTNLEKVYAKK